MTGIVLLAVCEKKFDQDWEYREHANVSLSIYLYLSLCLQVMLRTAVWIASCFLSFRFYSLEIVCSVNSLGQVKQVVFGPRSLFILLSFIFGLWLWPRVGLVWLVDFCLGGWTDGRVWSAGAGAAWWIPPFLSLFFLVVALVAPGSIHLFIFRSVSRCLFLPLPCDFDLETSLLLCYCFYCSLPLCMLFFLLPLLASLLLALMSPPC